MSYSASLSGSIASDSVVAAARLVSSCGNSGGEIWASWAAWAVVRLICWQRAIAISRSQSLWLKVSVWVRLSVGRENVSAIALQSRWFWDAWVWRKGDRLLNKRLLTQNLANTWQGISKTPGVCGGDACIRKTRIPVWVLVSFRHLGMNESQLLDNYPTLTKALGI